MNYRTYDTSQGFGSAAEWKHAFAETMGLDEAHRVMGNGTPEDILGIATGCVWLAVQRAFRAKAMDCHPDRTNVHGLPVALATEQFKQLMAAFTILKSRYRR